MREELLRKIQKLEVRMDNFLRKEDTFIKEVTKWIDKLKELNTNLERWRGEANLDKAKELMELRLRIVESFNEMIRKESEAEHGKSHLIECCGSLLLAVEKETMARMNEIVEAIKRCESTESR